MIKLIKILDMKYKVQTPDMIIFPPVEMPEEGKPVQQYGASFTSGEEINAFPDLNTSRKAANF